MTDAERRAALGAIAAEVDTCTRCRLHEGRTKAVPGEGNPDTEVVFVGEGPGFNEDRQGRPFVGRAGDLLVKMLGSIGWRRDDVFITNIVKCRPPDNRDPEPDEIAACAPYLRRQLEALDPALVVTLGRHSMGRFMPGARIGQVHGTYQEAPADAGADNALVYAMYHPAAALRTSQIERVSYDDMAGVPLALLESRRSTPGARRGGHHQARSPDRRDRRDTSRDRGSPRPLRPIPCAVDPEPATQPSRPPRRRRRRRRSRPRPICRPRTSSRCSDDRPTAFRPRRAAPHHPARRGGRDRQEHVRLRVRRRHRRHRLRPHVPRRGDVRHRPRRARRHLPQGAPGERPGVPHHPRPRGPRRRPAVHPARVPRRARSTPRRSRAASSATRSRSTSSTTTRCSPSSPATSSTSGRSTSSPSASATPSPTRWGSPSGPRSGRSSTPATSSSTTPRSTASTPTSTRSRGSARRASSASCRTPPAPRTPATRRRSGPSARPSARSWSRSTGG